MQSAVYIFLGLAFAAVVTVGLFRFYSGAEYRSKNNATSFGGTREWIMFLIFLAILFALSQIHMTGHRPLYVDRMIKLQKAAVAYAADHGGEFPQTISELIGTDYLKDPVHYVSLFDLSKLTYFKPETSTAGTIGHSNKDAPLMEYKREHATTTITIAGKISTDYRSRQDPEIK